MTLARTEMGLQYLEDSNDNAKISLLTRDYVQTIKDALTTRVIAAALLLWQAVTFSVGFFRAVSTLCQQRITAVNCACMAKIARVSGLAMGILMIPALTALSICVPELVLSYFSLQEFAKKLSKSLRKELDQKENEAKEISKKLITILAFYLKESQKQLISYNQNIDLDWPVLCKCAFFLMFSEARLSSFFGFYPKVSLVAENTTLTILVNKDGEVISGNKLYNCLVQFQSLSNEERTALWLKLMEIEGLQIPEECRIKIQRVENEICGFVYPESPKMKKILNAAGIKASSG